MTDRKTLDTVIGYIELSTMRRIGGQGVENQIRLYFERSTNRWVAKVNEYEGRDRQPAIAVAQLFQAIAAKERP